MGGPLRAKRAREERRPKTVKERPSKKQKRQALAAYHSSSEDEAEQGGDFDAVNLLDSDDDIHNAQVDDVAESDAGTASSDDDAPAVKPLAKLPKKTQPKKTQKAKKPVDAQSNDEEEPEAEDDDDDDDEDDDELELSDDEYLSDEDDEGHKSKSKRNDPNAFATSLNKILSTKLSTAKRADPVLSRSAAAHEASKAAVDSALEAKAKKQLRDEKRRAKEKGRVRDVLIATTNEHTGEVEESTAEIMETERRLRKVAQRGVVRLFNAVRAAQVQAAEASKAARSGGTVGMGQKEEKVTQMSKKGFLDLIASGGGGLKKGGLEEA